MPRRATCASFAPLLAAPVLLSGCAGGGYPAMRRYEPCDPEVRVPEVGRPGEPRPEPPEVTDAPRLLNRDRLMRYIDRLYPAGLRDRRIGGTVQVSVGVGTDGRVSDVRLFRSSGQDELDEAALRAARIMEFRPALDGACAVPIWLGMPLVFRVHR